MSRYLIAGLGNPGRKYAKNRHNVGARCIERLAADHDLPFNRRQKSANLALGAILQHPVALVKPRTYMNRSGRPIAALASFYRVPLDRLLVVYDDLDLPLGTTRMRPSGGSGGHRGMRSIINQLGRRDFPRLRIGIGRPPGRMDPADYVLQDFSDQEENLLAKTLDQATAAIETWLGEGVDEAMTRYNRGVEDGPVD
ncbi:MAG: aminoacyl-tRNA hydrolase [Anaerolineae bacterium]|jgi:PTH1 family peptidyl-tRNA hydrolase